jgi:hypothetical protein
MFCTNTRSRRAAILLSRCSRKPAEIACGKRAGGFLRLAAPLVALLLNSCAGGAGGPASSSSVPLVTVTVAPAAATVAIGGTAQFNATVKNASAAAIQWQVNRVTGGTGSTGMIDSSGLYRAPAIVPAASVEITAVLQADANRYGSASVTVVQPVSVAPRQVALTTSQSMQFAVSGPGADAGVTWSASGGSITPGGFYSPPSAAGVYTVTATSRSDAAAQASAIVYVTTFAGQSSWRNDAGLTGQNLQELALNPSTVAGGNFGKIASCPVDGQIYAQPLYAANLVIGNRARNVVYVATEHDSVYAFDAGAVPCEEIWTRSLLDAVAGETPVPSGDVAGSDISPEIGITGTPVMDRAGGALYLMARTVRMVGSGMRYAHWLHALDLATGAEKFGGPVEVTASVPGIGDGNDGQGRVIFDPLLENQRAAMQLAGGKLYIAFTGHAPASGYHGWLLVYDAASLAQADAFNITPDASRGGIAAAPSADASGSIYVATGHGAFDATTSVLLRRNFSQTLLKLQPPPLAIADAARDAFTPFDQDVLSFQKADFGSTGVLILPDQIGAPHPRLAVVGGTHGVLYLASRDDLGGFVPSGPDRVLQTINLARSIHGTPAYWQNTLYVAAAGDALKAFPLTGSTLANVPNSQSSVIVGGLGASPVVSSNGGSGGIVWLVDTSGADSSSAQPAVLRAYDATDLARELYSSSLNPADAAGPAVRLAVPTVANGRVYVGTQNELTVYGLLP